MCARFSTAVVALAALPAHAVLPTVPSHGGAEAAPAVGAGGLLQAGFGMVVVLGLIFLCAWLARRFGLQRFNGGNVVKVVSSSNIGQRERVVVVEVGGNWLVLGVTHSQINTLHTLPAQAMPQDPVAANAAALKPIELFAQKLRESITGKTRPAP
ncbi:flagellar biosynthetic protein FliO [Variovorax ureilyticus]|uniref:Flagellar protein n=1 Tax=Variovorax ureilyticus TaxID=1836198 RepID=A0ABU8VBR4_9BURK